MYMSLLLTAPYLKVIILKISVLVCLATAMVTGGYICKCSLILQQMFDEHLLQKYHREAAGVSIYNICAEDMT